MFINRYTKFALTVALALACLNFFGMAAPVIAAPGSDEEQLIEAARAGDLARIQNLFYENPRINVDAFSSPNGMSALMRAANLSIFKELIKHNAHVDARNSNGETALMWAAFRGHLDIVIYSIEELHADVHEPDNGDNTTLTYAAMGHHFAIIKYLVEHMHVDIHHRNSIGATALMFATNHGDLDIVKCLINAGADVHTGENTGITPLMSAAKGGLETMQYLVAQGVDVHARDNSGDTALIRAAYYGRLDAVRYLVENCHADMYTRDNEGYTALDRAKSQRRTNVAQYLATVMAQRQSLFALLLCDKFAPSGDSSFIDFKPEDIDRILRPTIAAAMLVKK